MKPINRLTFALLGAGGRGTMFAEWLEQNLGQGSVVAVAEPKADRRSHIAQLHGIGEENCFDGWEELLARPKLADVVINTTMDQEHIQSAVMAMRNGYHMLLEKPMATTLEDCAAIDSVRRETGSIVSVCHSLRYHAVYREVRRLLRSGAIGKIVSVDQLEAVEHIHQSHSFVRGNWGNQSRSSFMLMTKSCHDIDILADIIDEPCESVSSYGSLSFFNSDNAPEGAPKFCVQGCPVEESCPYSALKIYGEDTGWTRHAGLSGISRHELIARLASDRYGRCVFQCDNDVVDHQVVAMQFAGGITATFTMTAFTPTGGRYLRIHGTKGYLEAKIDQNTVDLYEFWANNRHTRIDVPVETGAHGGADASVIRNLIDAVVNRDPGSVLTSTAASLRTHTIVFAAEKSRLEGQVVKLGEMKLPSRVS